MSDSTVPSLAEMVGPLDAWQARLADLSPVWPAVEALYNRLKDQDFKAGKGPGGPHRPLKPSTRKRHRTGVPLYNRGELADSFREPGSAYYDWQADAQGWEHTSRHPALKYLEAKGYDVVGLTDEDWAAIDEIVNHYLDTGEVTYG